MAITLDSATEQKVQQELAKGRFDGPSELIAHALDLVAAERHELSSRREVLLRRLEESCAQADRGEGFGEEELRARMAERRTRLAKTA